MLELRRHSPELLELRIPYTRDIPHDFLLVSDVHLDNPHCDRELLRRHLNQAQGRGAPVLCFGDLLCLMQGRRDRRGSKSSLRPEHAGSNYFDLVFDECAEWLSPWASSLALISDGNHETAVLGNQEIDPLENLTRRLRGYGSKVEHLPYQGWVWLTFYRPGASRQGRTRRVTMFFHHGAWGGIISKGVMGGGRYASIAPEADVIVNGHNHERTAVSHACYRVTQRGQQRIQQRWHLQLGTYKEEFQAGSGWAVEKIVMPKSLGGFWLRCTPRDEGVEIGCEPA
jgi:hypothetical protein